MRSRSSSSPPRQARFSSRVAAPRRTTASGSAGGIGSSYCNAVAERRAIDRA
ncbi:hypothetical protein [Micromonospora chalcea]|uniref:hypothetical protein n=1 Tax=Micromonospora chalcea TaxID=1874 RepID=UPI0033221FEF